jgi:hypothetical protein
MAKPKDQKSLIQDITNRFRVTAREARDIVTAVNTASQALLSKNVNQRPGAIQAAALDVKKQVKETANAAATGKKGTGGAKFERMYEGSPKQVTPGVKRK